MGVADEAACPGWLSCLPWLAVAVFEDIAGMNGYRNCLSGTVFQELMLLEQG